MFGRYSYFHDVDQPVPFLPDGSGNITTGVIGLTDTLGQQVVGSYTHTFNQRTLNNFKFGYTRRSFQRRGVLLNTSPSEDLGIPGIPSNGAFDSALPVFSIAGYQQIGSPSNTNSNFRTDVTELTDTVSHLVGRHSLKFGFDLRWRFRSTHWTLVRVDSQNVKVQFPRASRISILPQIVEYLSLRIENRALVVHFCRRKIQRPPQSRIVNRLVAFQSSCAKYSWMWARGRITLSCRSIENCCTCPSRKLARGSPVPVTRWFDPGTEWFGLSRRASRHRLLPRTFLSYRQPASERSTALTPRSCCQRAQAWRRFR